MDSMTFQKNVNVKFVLTEHFFELNDLGWNEERTGHSYANRKSLNLQ
jgi:hypothetical protein